MGKASKWIMNFLVGKKDQEKNKKKSDASSSSFSLERKVVNNNRMSITTITTTPKVKRRWSFGRSPAPPTTGTGTETPPTHRTNLSFDSFITRQLLTKALLDGKYEQNLQNRLVARNAAATRIQAAFRSYLARKALGALKGLVKIQALVRGHLVRKQTTSMLRSMNALMAIQIRARFHRIQKSEESQQLVVEKQTSHGDSRNYLKSKSAHQNIEPKTKRTEDRIITYNSSSLSVSKRDHQFQITYPNSPYTDTTPRIYSFDAFLYNNNNTKESSHNGPKTDQIGYEDTPSYMANTESFRAKVRSQSEPKRRPVTQKNRRTASSDMRTVTPDNQTRGSSPVLRDDSMKNQHPWLIKLYRSSKSVKDIECDSRSSMMTNEEDYRRSLIAYEPSVNLY